MTPVIGGILGGLLHVGVWPLLYGFSMLLSQAMSPQTGIDPTQQMLFKLMPIFFTFILAQYAVGLSDLLDLEQPDHHRAAVPDDAAVQGRQPDRRFHQPVQRPAGGHGLTAAWPRTFDAEGLESARVLFARPATFMMGAVSVDALPSPPTCPRCASPAAPTSASRR